MSRSWIGFLARLIFVTFSVVSIVFFLQRLLPGSPVDAVLGPEALHSDKQRWLATHGFNKSLSEQYFAYIWNLVRGDFGTRWMDGRPVWPLMAERFLQTIRLAGSAFSVSLCCAFLFGVVGALKAGSKTDKWLAVFSLLFISAPSFISGTALLWFFSVWLDLLPLTGSQGWKSLVLPSVALGITLAAITGRMLRASLLEVLNEDYIRTANSKGLSRTRVFMAHALKNALLPSITVLGLQMGSLLGGAIITEQVFTWPGLGSLMMEAIGQRDYNLLSGCVVLLAIVHVCAAALVDAVHQCVDPRLGGS
jgi:peptide/nickel transport system permease protein